MIKVGRRNASSFDISRLLQRGVYVKRPEATSVSGFVHDLLAIDEDVMKRAIGTVMIDHQVVDEPSSAPLAGKTLVLSGAMPGLVGAMLRSGSPYGAMRSSITAGLPSRNTGSGYLRVKLLNTVLRDYGERMIDRGFWIEEDA